MSGWLNQLNELNELNQSKLRTDYRAHSSPI